MIARLLTVLLTALLGFVTYQSNRLLQQFQPDFNLLLSPPELAVRLILGGIFLFLAWLSGLSTDQLGLTLPDLPRTIGLGMVIGLSTQLFIYMVTSWAIWRWGRDLYSPLVIRNILPRRTSEWLPVALAFIPAVGMEELLFRTLWLGLFGSVLPVWALIIATSVVFGIMHLPQGKLGVILTGSINIFFCWLFIWSGTLALPFVAHYTVNLVQVIVAYRQRAWLDDYEHPFSVDKRSGT